MKYKAVILDFDGLMVNTERMTCDHMLEEAKKLNYPLTEDIYRQLIGGSTNVFDECAKKYPFLYEVSREVEKNRFEFFYQYFPHPGDCNKPGLENLYHYLKDNNYKIAVASSSSKNYLHKIIAYLGFDFQVDVIVGGDEVKAAKPDPYVFLLAQKKLGVSNSECIILEDSRNGIIAASRAHIDSIFIEDMVKADDTMKENYLVKLNDLNEVIDYLKKN